jgi:hypothetical protein
MTDNAASGRTAVSETADVRFTIVGVFVSCTVFTVRSKMLVRSVFVRRYRDLMGQLSRLTPRRAVFEWLPR